MSVVHQAFQWNWTQTVTLSDTAENARGAVGFHTGAGGAVAVTYHRDGDEVDDILTVAAGAFVITGPLVRIKTTGTVPIDVRLLMP